MKNILLASAAFFITCFVTAQQVDSATTAISPKKIKNKVTGSKLSNKASDHFMLQFTGDTWAGKPDSITTKGIGRGANIYFMLNYPFKTNPKLSVAIGAGFGTSSIYLRNRRALIEGTSTNIIFRNLDSLPRFKKYKVATAYLEAPIELRYFANPNNVDRCFKAAIGVKVGTLLTAYTKGKNLQTSDDQNLNSYTEKIKKKDYFNSTRISLTARVGWGNFNAFAQYQVTNTFKDVTTSTIRPYSIGIAISGL